MQSNADLPEAGTEELTLGEVYIDGWRVNVRDQASAVRAVMKVIECGEGSTFFTLNLDHLVKLRRDAKFRDAYRNATFVSADGAPVVAIGRRTWKELQRATGADLMLPLCVAAADAGYPVFLFGSSDDVLQGTARLLTAVSGGRIAIAGSVAPPRDFDPEGDLADRYIEAIRQSDCRLCFVLLGAPKQEIFAARAQRRGLNCCFACVGGAADFLSGQTVRAPLSFQRFGLEWLWRLVHEPRRLGLRYVRCALLLADMEWARLLRPRGSPQ